METNYSETAKNLIDLMGGMNNIGSVSHCMTRLHFTVKNNRKVQQDALKKADGVMKVVASINQYQIVVGIDVADIYDEIVKVRESMPERDPVSGVRSFFMEVSSLIHKIYFPLAGVISGAGMLKGLSLLAVSLGVMSDSSAVYTVLDAISEGILYFLPVFVSYTTALFFEANPYVSMAASSAFVYPGISALLGTMADIAVLPLPAGGVRSIGYTYSVLPVFAAVYLQSKLEKWLKKVLPVLTRDTLLPFISLTVTSLLTFLVIGPFMNWLGDLTSFISNTLIRLSPEMAGLIIGACYPLLIALGLQWGLIPVYFLSFKANGYDNIMIFTVATNFILAGVALGVYLKSKNKKMKDISFSAFLYALVGGVTEPSMYNCTLKFKRPLVITCAVDALCGLLIGVSRTVQHALVSWNLLTIPALVGGSGIYTLYAILIGFFSAALLVYLFGFDDKMLEDDPDAPQ